MHTVYILQNDGGKYYIGCTGDLENRMKRHSGKRSKFTSQYCGWRVVYNEDCADKSSALKRERFIKNKKSRQYIESLISQYSGVEK